jgi:hypothetical protein
MFPTTAQKDVAALAAAALINALLSQGVPFPRAAKSGADLLLLGSGLLSPEPRRRSSPTPSPPSRGRCSDPRKHGRPRRSSDEAAVRAARLLHPRKG